MPREENAPLPTPEDVIRELERLADSNPHRRPTAVGVDAGLVRQEVALGEQTRRTRRRSAWCTWAMRGGAVAGYAALALEIWRTWR